MFTIQMPGERFGAPGGIIGHDLTTDLEWLVVVCACFRRDGRLASVLLDGIDNLSDEVGPDPRALPAVKSMGFLGWRCEQVQ